MHCSIYKSSKKDEMYLYVARPAANENEAEEFNPLDVLSEPVRAAFGRAAFVMHLEFGLYWTQFLKIALQSRFILREA